MPAPFAAAALEPSTATKSPFTGLGYPTLTIRATDAGFVAPASVDAGRYLVTLTNVGSRHVEAQFVLPPLGVSADEVVATLAGAGTLPAWFYRAIWNGGPADASPSTFATAQVVVDLTPGTWLIVHSDRDRPIAPATLTVTDRVDALDVGPAPDADLLITMRERGFDCPVVVTAGPRVWAVSNVGKVPHELILLSYPRPVTLSQVVAAMLAGDGQPSSGAGIDPDLLAFVGYVPLLSPSVTTWVAMDLAPGSYVAMSGIVRADSAGELELGSVFAAVRGSGTGWGRR
jgi:hypothetical protein